VGDQEGAVGLRQHVGQIARAEPRVDRHQDGADLRNGEQGEEVFRAVVEPEADVLARPLVKRALELFEAENPRIDVPEA
jgi:hypothetical protein